MNKRNGGTGRGLDLIMFWIFLVEAAQFSISTTAKPKSFCIMYSHGGFEGAFSRMPLFLFLTMFQYKNNKEYFHSINLMTSIFLVDLGNSTYKDKAEVCFRKLKKKKYTSKILSISKQKLLLTKFTFLRNYLEFSSKINLLVARHSLLKDHHSRSFYWECTRTD